MRNALGAELAAALRFARAFGLVARTPDPSSIELLAAAWAYAAGTTATAAVPRAGLAERLAEVAWKIAR